ncbi:MAG: hypothetical protein D6812_02445 [Deltaproteobacteria bacterium]|nr:MAG: hypothetical protein D6812_02445 [Deltaproteobacteria bacterium]
MPFSSLRVTLLMRRGDENLREFRVDAEMAMSDETPPMGNDATPPMEVVPAPVEEIEGEQEVGHSLDGAGKLEEFLRRFNPWIPLRLAGAFLFGWCIGSLVGRWSIYWRTRALSRHLRRQKALLDRRLATIHALARRLRRRYRQIESLELRARQSGRPTQHLRRTMRALAVTLETLEAQRERLDLLDARLDLQRWKNGLLPFLQEMQRGREFNIGMLERHILRGRKMLQSAPKRFREEWHDWIEKAERLKERWLLTLAIEDIRRVRPLDDYWAASEQEEAVDAITIDQDLEETTMMWAYELKALDEEFLRLVEEAEVVTEMEKL